MTVSAKDKKDALNLIAALSSTADYRHFTVWLIGDTPLICHAWSEKAKSEMLRKHVKATRSGRDAKNPDELFSNSLYRMGENLPFSKQFGFPATAIKKAMLSTAHKDKGVAKVAVMASLWIDAEMVRTMPALAGARCDMPLVRVYGSEPEMREDMVRVGKGLNTTADLAYRAQFTVWALRVTGRINTSVITPDSLVFLLSEAGLAVGLGDWRNEKKGVFGSFHVATAEEQEAWEKFRSGDGPLPIPESQMMMAAE